LSTQRLAGDQLANIFKAQKANIFKWKEKIKGKQAGTNNGNLRRQVAVAIRGI
jgi:hypothetical protein